MRVLICGGRLFLHRDYAFGVLDDIRTQLQAVGVDFTRVIHGGARGADRIAADWAETRGIPDTEFAASWGKYGRSAGAIRNRDMLAEGQPQMVIAFPGGDGTADMVKQATMACLLIVEVEPPTL